VLYGSLMVLLLRIPPLLLQTELYSLLIHFDYGLNNVSFHRLDDLDEPDLVRIFQQIKVMMKKGILLVVVASVMSASCSPYYFQQRKADRTIKQIEAEYGPIDLGVNNLDTNLVK